MRGRALSQSPHSCDNRSCLAAEAEAQEVTGAFLHSSVLATHMSQVAATDGVFNWGGSQID